MFVVWDDAKAEANLVKHGIDFETAKAVFDDPAHLVVAAKTVAGEPRRMALGRVDDELVLAVVHVVREIENPAYNLGSPCQPQGASNLCKSVLAARSRLLG